ncbi:MAG: hypothetical protein A2Y25_09040 [Candidatus Melainabacteria bacterium GWF2_37_15]|nr:MAG: hypothetical protein A2Y25_09040 [Candidatus Melainabacteria bacterium GWF2_37_15]
MNTIYRIQQKPYVLDPLPLNKGYLFPNEKNRVNKNNVSFTSNNSNPFRKTSNELTTQIEKFRELQTQLRTHNNNGTQLNTIA